MSKSWCVVEFVDGVQIVPQLWIEGDKCYWPSTMTSQQLFEKTVKEYREPNKSWDLHKVRILGVYASYELAVPKRKLAEVQSDLNTDDEPSRKSRAKRKKIVWSSEDESSVNSDEEVACSIVFPKVPTKLSKNGSGFSHTQNNLIPIPSYNTSIDETRVAYSARCSSLNSTNKFPLYEPNKNDVLFTEIPKEQSVDILPYSVQSCPSLDSTNKFPLSEPNKNDLLFTPRRTEQSTTTTTPYSVQSCCVCCCKFDKEYKQKTEISLHEINSQLKLVLQILREKPEAIATTAGHIVDDDDYRKKVLLHTEEDVSKWEIKLNNTEEQQNMISFLTRIGGSDINSIVKNILRKVFTDSLASSYNWEGKKGKKMFSCLIIADCIKKAAASSPNTTKTTTEQDIVICIKNWLRHALARSDINRKNKNEDA